MYRAKRRLSWEISRHCTFELISNFFCKLCSSSHPRWLGWVRSYSWSRTWVSHLDSYSWSSCIDKVAWTQNKSALSSLQLCACHFLTFKQRFVFNVRTTWSFIYIKSRNKQKFNHVTTTYYMSHSTKLLNVYSFRHMILCHKYILCNLIYHKNISNVYCVASSRLCFAISFELV